MGQTAEVLSREFKITRQEQDQFALLSQQRVEKAIKDGFFMEEIAGFIAPKFEDTQMQDEGPRASQTLDALEKLKPIFDSLTGTVTAGNSSPITDGAAAVLLMKESKAKELRYEPLGYIRDYAVAALQPSRMGLGPAFAISKLLKKTGVHLSDIDLIEVNEAFAAQVLAVVKACASTEFAKKELGSEQAVGEIDMQKLNVNGGAIALGHPLGASGARLVITLLRELRRRKEKSRSCKFYAWVEDKGKRRLWRLNNMSAFNFTIDPQGICRLVFDLPNEKVNKLSLDVLLELEQILNQLIEKKEIKALALSSAKRDIFIAGADF